MKKQILTLFVSLFIGFMGAYGQMVTNSAPRTLTCETGPLNPVAGTPYDYSAYLSPANGSAYWFATTDVNIMTTSGLTANQESVAGSFVSAATNYQENTPGDTSPTTTNITWDGAGLSNVDDANPLFVVLHYTAPTGACADNLKVYRIEPKNAFMVNVLNLGETVYGTAVESCFSDMASAVYDLANSCMTYNYGENTLAYEVVAANFSGGYTPSFRVDGIQTGQSVEVFYNVTNDISTATTAGTLTADGVITLTNPVTTTLTNTSVGVSLYVWLVVDNGTFEGIADTPITFAAAGTNLSSEPSVRWDDCDIEVDINAVLTANNAPDFGIHTLNARPTVTTNTENAAGESQPFEVTCP